MDRGIGSVLAVYNMKVHRSDKYLLVTLVKMLLTLVVVINFIIIMQLFVTFLSLTVTVSEVIFPPTFYF